MLMTTFMKYYSIAVYKTMSYYSVIFVDTTLGCFNSIRDQTYIYMYIIYHVKIIGHSKKHAQ